MAFPILTWFGKRRKTRLKVPDQDAVWSHSSGWHQAAVGLFYGFFIWVSVMLLRLIGTEPLPLRLVAGQWAPVTVTALVDFAYQPAGKPNAGWVQVPAGTCLVKRGDTLSPDMIAMVRAHGAQWQRLEPFRHRLVRYAGDGILLALGLLAAAVLLRLLQPALLRQNRLLLLALVISLLSLIPTTWGLWLEAEYSPLPETTVTYLLPLALTPLLAGLLLGRWPALIVGVWVTLVSAIMANYSLVVFVTGLLEAVTITALVQGVRTRGGVFRIGLWAGLAGVACAVGFSAVTHQDGSLLVQQSLAVLASGIISALIGLLILPLLEVLFGVSTDISLLELADMEHPLLKRLAMEAPGTYHHSLMVSNLAQAAVTVVGGNALRTAISAYFHDLGKLVKPEFFSENMPLGYNPHDDLAPSMSSLVIISHVKEGINLALRYKLPRVIVDAVQQHHGTGLVSYFYHKASAQSEPGANGAATVVSEEQFRYPGPKPRTREIAVLALADAVEAASRSLEKISPANLENLVQEIVQAKISDGQLDQCDLTLADLAAIRKVFVFTLSNMFHSRIAYTNHDHHARQSADAPPA